MPGVIRDVDLQMKLHRNREFYDYNLDDGRKELKLSSTVRVLSPSSSTGSSSASCSPNGSIISLGLGGCNNYIQHYVSKMDTLAGIAIMYGVEVTDIKRINGLMTDRQMFALKSIHIPLPGKHPPSPTLSRSFDDQCNGVDRSELQVRGCRRSSDLLTSFQSLQLNSSSPDHSHNHREVSPAMSILQSFYGLKPTREEKVCSEMMHNKEGDSSQYLELDSPSCSNPHLSHRRRSKSIDYSLSENGKSSNTDDDNAVTADSITNSDRRCQAPVIDFGSLIPEKPLKEDCGREYSAIAGTGLALRSKAASRNMIASGIEPSSDGSSGRTLINPSPIRLGNSCGADGCIEVRKSCSLSSIQDQDNNSSSSSSIWPKSKWRLKSDRQLLSTAVIAKPIFDGFPKPIVGRRNKAALD
ncbi:uncharacterized protein LOC124921612 [Impatiens glandulifera]|uniref:uncharacterized protein LOC124921612 n=1 Tax=Impatiens glandulifera TaxID=253017 RepID=UPI001FB0B3F7|nr:uncharacterized protein LOC124921612 [Impatiens glandulifera]